MDGERAGLFRGRFGTEPAAHPAGTPVIVFPFRYWDRWAERADAPELHYFQFSIDQPQAYWLTGFFRAEELGLGGPRLEALVRTDPRVPWDADPDLEDGLLRLESGMPEGAGNPLRLQADRVEARLFVRYPPGAFDAATGLSSEWKRAPRLELFGFEFLGPGATLWRVER